MIKNLKSYLDNIFQEAQNENTSHQNKIELATAVLMIEISLADENTGPEEYEIIKKILLEKFNLDKKNIDAYIHKYEEYYIRKIADLLHVSHSDYIKTKLKAEK